MFKFLYITILFAGSYVWGGDASSFKQTLQQWCDTIEKCGQYYVNKLVYYDCHAPRPESVIAQCPSLQAMDWRHHIDDKSMDKANALLALAQLSNMYCSWSLNTADDRLSSDSLSLSRLPVCLANESKLYDNIPLALLKNDVVLAQAKPNITQANGFTPAMFHLSELLYEGPGPFGNKNNSIYKTHRGERIYVKDRHLKVHFDSLFISYLTSKLGEKLCPGQIVKVVPIIDGQQLKIGSFEVKDYLGLFGPFGERRVLLSLVLDLMSIMDRGRHNIGYSRATNLAVAVDVDLGGFVEGAHIEQNRGWIHRIRQNYDAIGDEFKTALQSITKFTDAEITKFLDDAELELQRDLPHEHHSMLSVLKDGLGGNPVSYIAKARVIGILQQMRWVLENFDIVSFVINNKDTICLSDLLDQKHVSDEHGFFLFEAIERHDHPAIEKLCKRDSWSYKNILNYASFRVSEKSTLEVLLRCCKSNPNWSPVAENFQRVINNLN
jgi:hypothetical protein